MPGARYVTPSTLAERTAAWLAALAPFARPRPLPSLASAALLVLDVQRYFADAGSHAFLPALEAVRPRILELVEAFRGMGRPVVLTQHGSHPGDETLMQRWWRDDLRAGEERAQLVPELAGIAVDRVLPKSRYSAFAETDLRAWLAGRGCDTVVITGVMTHLCCETTARDAFLHELRPVVVADACASVDEELHVGALRALAHGFAHVATARQISDQLAGGAPSDAGQDTPPPPWAPAEGAAAVPSRSSLVVVGAGPAGIAAAIEARRQGVEVVLLERERPGGQARTAGWVENYPGFPGGIAGDRLMERFWAQAREWGLQALPFDVRAVERAALTPERAAGLRLLAPARELHARAAILATGAAPLPLAGAGAHVVHRLDALPSVRGAHVLVVGGGEAALDQALLAHRRGAREVRVAVRGQPRAMALLVGRAREAQIPLLCDTRLASLVPLERIATGPDPRPPRLRATLAGANGRREELEVDAVVACVGKEPDLPRLPDDLARSPAGTPLVDELGRTSVEGLYLAGDARRGRYRQTAIAVGDGVAAAMDAVLYLRHGTWRS